MGRVVIERERERGAHCKAFFPSIRLKPAGEAEDVSRRERERAFIRFVRFFFVCFLLCASDDPRAETGVTLR